MERTNAVGIVGERERMNQSMKFLAASGEFVAQAFNLVFVIHVAAENIALTPGPFPSGRGEIVGEQFGDVLPHFVILDDVNAFRARLLQHAANMPRNAFAIRHAEDQDRLTGEL